MINGIQNKIIFHSLLHNFSSFSTLFHFVKKIAFNKLNKQNICVRYTPPPCSCYGTVRQGDLDLQGDYDNVLSDFDRVYYSVLPYLSKVILNANDMNCTCQHQGCIICDQQYLHSSIIHPIKVRWGIIIVTLQI